MYEEFKDQMKTIGKCINQSNRLEKKLSKVHSKFSLLYMHLEIKLKNMKIKKLMRNYIRYMKKSIKSEHVIDKEEI